MVVLLAIALTAGAYCIHKIDFCDPNHPLCNREKVPAEHGGDDAHGPPGEHGDGAAHTPAADHKGDPTRRDSGMHADTGHGRSGH